MSQPLLTEIVKSIPVGIYRARTTADGQFFLDYVSPRLAELLGVPAEAILADPQMVFRAEYPGEREDFLRHIQKAAATGTAFLYEGPMLVHGVKRWAHMEAVPVMSDGPFIFWDGVLIDITRQKQVEDELRESEQCFRALFDGSAEAVTLVAHGTVVDCNEAAVALLGYTRKMELIGKSPAELSPTYQPDGRASAELVRQHTATALERGSNQVEWVYLRADGSQCYVEAILTALTLKGQPILHVVSRDIGRRKEAERERAILLAREQAARHEAEVTSRAKDRFLATLSHELRTPLTPVMLKLSEWAEPGQLPLASREDLQMVLRNLEVERVLIDDLLDLSLIAHDKLRLHKRQADLHQLIREACEIVGMDQGAPIELELADGPAVGELDGVRIRQVVWNLLRNARKFTPPTGRIIVSSGPLGGELRRIEVRDTGVGIAAEQLHRIFDPFEQGTQDSSRPSGLGLGLAIAKAIVVGHGGTIQAHSEGRGRGAMFRVELPLRPAGLDAQMAQAVPGTPRPQPAPCRVLLVEDHPDTARVLAGLLSRAGYTVRMATSYSAAVELIEAELPDVLLSDLGLPDGTGHDLMRHLRARHPAVKGIALSGFGAAQDIQASQEAGFSEHLTKPATPERLFHSLARLCGQPGHRPTGGGAPAGPGNAEYGVCRDSPRALAATTVGGLCPGTAGQADRL